MVFLRVKNKEYDVFLFESKTDIPIDQVIRDVVRVYNLRVKLNVLVSESEELLKYGVSKPPEKQGLDEETLKIEEEEDETIVVGKGKGLASDLPPVSTTKDPTLRRWGNPPTDERVVHTLTNTIEEGKSHLSKDLISKKICLTDILLTEKIDLIEGAIKIAYPMGLPEYDPISQILQPDYTHTEMMKEEETTIWFAGKELLRDQKLSDSKSIGRNEKTTIIIKLSKRGSGPPVRESPVSEEEQKRMMAYYYKKQEEQKKLLEDEDDSFVNSSWANPKSMKAHFHGLGNVGWR